MVVAGLTVEKFGCKKLFVVGGLVQVSYFTPQCSWLKRGARSIDVLMYWHGHLHNKTANSVTLAKLKVYTL